eukprot:gene34320-41535_t
MGGGQSQAKRANYYVLKRIPKALQKWDEISSQWNHPNNPEYDYNSWDFNIWNLDHQQLFTLSFLIIKENNFHSTFGIRTDTWFNFMCEVQGLMGTIENPYHNFHHIMDVFQSCHVFIKDFHAKLWLTDIQLFCMLIACLVHDLEHPGTNNLYQVNAGTMLALRYNDIAVLENHHCSRAFEVINTHECNIFASMTLDQRKACRKYIIAMVLATDMTVHFSLKEELDQCVARLHALQQAADAGSSSGPIKIEEKDALSIMKAIVHTADISNPAKTWSLSKRWSDKVVEEFFAQGDREKKESLPVSMNCDRLTTNQDELSINFTDFIVAPFYFSITKLLPRVMKACRYLEDNRDRWDSMLKQRLQANQAESKVDEIIVRWEGRKAAFMEKMKDLQASTQPAVRVGADTV